MDTTKEIYVSTDVETDGPIPGVYSMLSLGSAAFLPDKTIIGTFSANFATLPGAITDPSTMEWWKGQPQAWQECHKDLRQPPEAMADYVKWLKALPGAPVFVAYPATFDFSFVYWYLRKFAGESPFSFSALDIKTLAYAMLELNFSDVCKTNMPKSWFDSTNKSHVALDDAIEQGLMFCNMLAQLRASRSKI